MSEGGALFLFIQYIIFSVIVSFVAYKKGRSPELYFFLALAVSPLVAVLLVIFIKDSEEQIELKKIKSGKFKKCPDCRELVKSDAIVCRYCDAQLYE